MPLWVYLLGAAAAVAYLASRASAQVTTNVTPGAASYTVMPGGAPYFSSDPSLGSGMTGVAPTAAGTIPAGTTVYAATSSPNNTLPVLSSDMAYQQIVAPGVGTVWVSIATLKVQ